MSLDPDALYRPLAGPEGWSGAASERASGAWLDAVERMHLLVREAPAWTDMVRRGMLLAAAHQSGALAGLCEADDGLASGLVAGVVSPASCGAAAEAHVLANHAALVLATAAGAARAPVTEAWIRRLHAVACAPQVTHPAPDDHAPDVHGARSPAPAGHGIHDHVLGHGDYKHHPNHVTTASGGWHAYAPVDHVAAEVARLVDALGTNAFASLPPTAQAAYRLYALHHVAPFAAGNGRAARALAAMPLLRVASIPLAVPAACADDYRLALVSADEGDPAPLVAFVAQRCAGIVDLADDARASAGSPVASMALRQWAARTLAAHRLHRMLAAAVEAALVRHRRRSDLGWMADLATATVVTTATDENDPRFDAPPVAIRVAVGDGPEVDEVLAIAAHPVTGRPDVVVVRAQHAELAMDVRPDDVAPPVPGRFVSRLDGLLDRAVTALAVRVAAEGER